MKKKILATLAFVASLAVIPFIPSSSNLCVFFVDGDPKRTTVEKIVQPIRFRDSGGDVLLYCAPAGVMNDLYLTKKIPTPMPRSNAIKLVGSTPLVDGGGL